MRNIRRDAALDLTLRRLGENQHSVAKRSIFPTLRDALCFAALLGYERDARVPLGASTVDLDGRLFANHSPTLDTMYLLGLATKRDMAILLEENEEELVTIFEEYACGGLRVIDTWFTENPVDQDGDNAIIDALRRHGYVSPPDDVGTSIVDVEF